jgi:hypothetical protein
MTMVRLVSSQDIERGPRSWQPTAVLEGGCEPLTIWEEEAWRWTASGRLLPRTGPRRIKLSTWRVSKEWRRLANELDRATDAIGAANDHDLDAALLAWATVAVGVLLCPFENPWALRDRLALACVLMGHPFEYGGHYGGTITKTQWVFSSLDSFAMGRIWAAEKYAPKRRPRTQRRRATDAAT